MALELDKFPRSHGHGQTGGPAGAQPLDAGDGLPAFGNQYVGFSQSGVVRVVPGRGGRHDLGGRVGGFPECPWPGKRGGSDVALLLCQRPIDDVSRDEDRETRSGVECVVSHEYA